MLVLPSVGAKVNRIILNESATKAKIFYDDGSTTIVSTKNSPTSSSVKRTTVSPGGNAVKKTVIKKTSGGGKVVNRSASVVRMEAVSPASMANRAPEVIERAKRRSEMLEAQTMDASAMAAMAMQEGQEIPIT